MYRLVATLLMLATAAPSLAADVKICVVDAESAINATREGKAAQASLKTSYAAKESELEAKRAKLQADIEDYEQRRLILSEDARRQEEQRLEQMTQEF
jgi:Skp family chaperone for outer membrane proteins